MATSATEAGRLVLGLGVGFVCGVVVTRLYVPTRSAEVRSLIRTCGQMLRNQTEDQLVAMRDRVGLTVGQAQIRSQDALLRRGKEGANS